MFCTTEISIFEIMGPGINLILVSIIMWAMTWLFKKGKVSINNENWDLIRKVVEDAIRAVEHMAFQKKKQNTSLTSEEKLKLAKDIIKIGLKRFKLERYEVLVEPLIYATLQKWIDREG